MEQKEREMSFTFLISSISVMIQNHKGYFPEVEEMHSEYGNEQI